MRYFTILLFLLFFSPLTAFAGPKEGWFFDLFPPVTWPENHWRGQNYTPSVNNNVPSIKMNTNTDHSIFSDVKSVKTEDLINNLKKADIIQSVYNHTERHLWEKKTTDDIIIELDHNFYTLSYTDQSIIADMLFQAYNRPSYMLKDSTTQDVVGQITESGLNLF